MCDIVLIKLSESNTHKPMCENRLMVKRKKVINTSLSSPGSLLVDKISPCLLVHGYLSAVNEEPNNSSELARMDSPRRVCSFMWDLHWRGLVRLIGEGNLLRA